jgi:hypothetical protein
MVTAARLSLPLLVVLVATGCKPNLNETVSLVSGTRVLAVQAEPAEVSPMAMAPVSFSLLVVDDNGVVTHPDAEWTFCQTRNPLANLGPVAPSCVQPWSQPPPVLEDGAGLCPDDASSCLVAVAPPYVGFGGGEAAMGIVPTNACSLFGPNPPPPLMNQPPGRPVDPDPTGGYYQPVTAFVVAQGKTIPTLFPYRISCGFANVDPTSSGELTSRYHLNVNPAVESLSIVGGATLQPDSTGMTNTVAAGQELQLEVAWPSCPLMDKCGDTFCGADESLMSCPLDCKTPKGCPGAERFVNFSLISESVVDQREGINVAWYATGGTFANDTTGNAGTDTTLTSDNGWTAPEASGPVHMWVVLADDRGGIGWAGYALNVQ